MLSLVALILLSPIASSETPTATPIKHVIIIIEEAIGDSKINTTKDSMIKFLIIDFIRNT